MVVEFLILATYLLSGVLVLRACGWRGPVVAPFGFIAGTALYVGIGLVQALVGVTTHPGLALAAALSIGAIAAVRSGTTRLCGTELYSVLGFCAGILGLVILVRHFNAYTLHMDSYRLMHSAALVARDQYDWLAPDLLTKRMAAYPILIAPSHLMDDVYLGGFAPVLTLAVVWSVGWLTNVNLKQHSSLSAVNRIALIVVLSLVLLTNSRVLWNSTYVNAHLLCAAYLMLLVASGWVRLVTPGIPALASLVLQSGAALGLALVRAEGPLIAAVALVPFICSTQPTPIERKVPLMVLGLSTALWHGYIVADVPGGAGSSKALLAFGVAIASVAPFVTHPRLSLLHRFGVVGIEVAICLALVALAFKEPKLMLTSAAVSVDNLVLGHAGWGSSVTILGVLTIALLLFADSPARQFLRFPVTTFVPMSLIFAYLRGSPYRVGFGDSFARGFVHIVPLAVLLLGTGFVARWRNPFEHLMGGWRESSRASKELTIGRPGA